MMHYSFFFVCFLETHEVAKCHHSILYLCSIQKHMRTLSEETLLEKTDQSKIPG